ncbi:hypothetical protein ABZX93_23005 [Streptomyces sp. NPDC006632]|uniref:hypothetical protein n=1 Tax=Streptomyces sp. NPDC006632 TaxID=3157182 RepID=UPI0033AE6EB3
MSSTACWASPASYGGSSSRRAAGSVNAGSVNAGSVNAGSVNAGSVNAGSASLCT